MVFGIRERSALIALMALNRVVPNSELNKLYGLGLDKAQRKRLISEGLIVSYEKSKRYSHELTDKGWAWVAQELPQSMPARSGSAAGALYALLNAIGTILKARDMQLAELFYTDQRLMRPLGEQISGAYRKLQRRPRDWVSLTKLRPLIEGATKAETDAVLLSMLDAQEIMLTLNEDRKALSSQDRAAAIRVGGIEMHFISME